jgi:cobyrinic acid a,c-diamide synthase
MARQMSGRGLVIAAPGSGSGKTTIALGLVRALRDVGVKVAAAKVGPDYIDPGFHAAAAGRACVNLDPWAMRPATLAGLTARLNAAADLIVCEGVMGLYDGIDASGAASTAALAARIGWPVVLVIDAAGLAASVAALLHGFAAPPNSLRQDGLSIAGVIFNRIGGERHLAILSEAVQRARPDLRIFGGVPRSTEIVMPERHLGLVPAGEQADVESVIEAAARLIAAHVDVDALKAAARPASLDGQFDARPMLPPLGQRIAVARDAAFAFAYPWILDAWAVAGASVSVFSPLADEAPPADADAVFLPGGYPELHAGPLAGNRRFLGGLRDAGARGATVYGECGGYMVLGRGLIDAAGQRHAMAGLLPLETSFADRRLHLGYREASVAQDGPLGPRGARWRGHEFHYASVVSEADGAPLFRVADARGHQLATAGIRISNVLGSFIHLIDHANV